MPQWPEPESSMPDLEDIMMDAEEGGCTTSCDEVCWVEPDGVCEHGHPSWMIRLGLI